jgi:peptide/nickel transport system substrate-binding protein
MARVSAAIWRRLQGKHGFSFKALPEPYGYAILALNMHSRHAPFLNDVHVRRALAFATDQPTMIRIIFGGMGTENHMPAPTGAGPWRGPEPSDGTAIHYDPAQAKAELAAAGWRPGPDGVRLRDGKLLAFTAITSEPDSENTRLLQMLREDLRKVGVDMSLQIMAYPQMTALLGEDSDAWDAGFQNVTPGGVPDGVTYFDTGGASNWGHYSDAEMDRLIGDTDGLPGPAALFAYQKYAEAQQPGLFLPQGKQLIMIAGRLHGVEDFVNEYGFWSPEYLAVDDPACHRPGTGAALP